MYDTTPIHQRPESCFVCGGTLADHFPAGASNTGGRHKFWSNADAMAEAREHDRKVRLARTPEAAFVAQHRPY